MGAHANDDQPLRPDGSIFVCRRCLVLEFRVPRQGVDKIAQRCRSRGLDLRRSSSADENRSAAPHDRYSLPGLHRTEIQIHRRKCKYRGRWVHLLDEGPHRDRRSRPAPAVAVATYRKSRRLMISCSRSESIDRFFWISSEMNLTCYPSSNALTVNKAIKEKSNPEQRKNRRIAEEMLLLNSDPPAGSAIQAPIKANTARNIATRPSATMILNPRSELC